ncbi:MAG: UbiX family flavin prenyltransferase [Nitrososphaerota archaeon]
MKLVVAITGASGAIYGVRLLYALKTLGIERHVILSKAGEMTLKYETGMDSSSIKELASRYYDESEIDAPISSGSFKTEGMIIAPCSTKSLASIAHGLEINLTSRAAMVTLKERRRLLLLLRETPLTIIHIKNMLAAAEAGAIIMPASPSFYSKPKTIEQMVDQTVGRILDLFGVEHQLVKRWKGKEE